MLILLSQETFSKQFLFNASDIVEMHKSHEFFSESILEDELIHTRAFP